MEITFLSDRTLTVSYADTEGPIEGGLLSFDWVEDGAETALELGKNKVYTDSVKGERVSTWRSSRTLRPSLLSGFQ